jgi:hypothetical protein
MSRKRDLLLLSESYAKVYVNEESEQSPQTGPGAQDASAVNMGEGDVLDRRLETVVSALNTMPEEEKNQVFGELIISFVDGDLQSAFNIINKLTQSSALRSALSTVNQQTLNTSAQRMFSSKRPEINSQPQQTSAEATPEPEAR